jgi:hypothetical protein
VRDVDADESQSVQNEMDSWYDKRQLPRPTEGMLTRSRHKGDRRVTFQAFPVDDRIMWANPILGKKTLVICTVVTGTIGIVHVFYFTTPFLQMQTSAFEASNNSPYSLGTHVKPFRGTDC